MKILITIFLLWLAYKVIFDFIIPVYQSTRQVRQQMGDIQARMREQFQQQQQAQRTAQQQQQQQQQQRASQQRPMDKGDYIDFEEVK
jgi:Sec-independent protein translocase protein TatA